MTAWPGTRVLLVEDSPDYALLVAEDLRLAWRGELEVRHFDRLADARGPLTGSADCVLLDLSLPDAHGLDALREVLGLAGRTPVVVLTGLGEEDGLGREALRLGAQDYLVKSRATGEAISRSVRYAIERRSGELERRRLEAAVGREAAVAEELRRGLVPELPSVPGLELAARYEPGGEGRVGGDWYDVVRLTDGRVGLAMGDVAGHGLPAAALMGQLASALRAHALADPEPAALLGALDAFLRHYAPGQIATLVWVLLDPETGAACAGSAGHPPALLLSAGGERSWLGEGRRALLGAPPAEGSAGGPAAARIGPGDTLLLYTDGLVERRGETVDAGLERLRDAAAGGETLAPAALLDRLLGALAPTDGERDDVAALAVRPRP